MAVAFQNNLETGIQSESEYNLLESEQFLSAEGKINVPLGVTGTGDLIVRDLKNIPHILVCGFTGTGKTAFVKTLISVILTNQSPLNVKMVIYDTKRVDYGSFGNAPHMLLPIISENDKAVAMLKYLAGESRRRFELFANNGCRDYEKYNDLQTDAIKKLPEIFAVLDDLAFLPLNKNEAYDFLSVLSNGRIAGIHAIVISSMNSTKNLQKEMISRIPCKICFRLSSRAESRMILGQSGAEELFIPGEMIYKFQNDYYKCQSAHATYENIDNVMKIASKVVTNMVSLGIEATMLFADFKPESGIANSNTDVVYDDLISEAAEEIINSQKASIGRLQRKFRIGFNRTARIMDQLEEIGVVGPENGAEPRIIIMDVDDWNRDSEARGLRMIGKSFVSNSSYSSSKQYTPIPKSKKEDEPRVKLRDFAEFAIGESTLRVHDHQIHYTKSVMTKLGKGHLTASFSGSNVIGLIYKKPSIFSSGYMTFEFDSNINIENKNPYLLQADKNNISDVIKIEFGSGQDRLIRLFLKQLSEDIGVPIKNV